MLIDGIASVESPDSAGEVLDISGADLSSVEDETSYCNYEHCSGDGGTAIGMVGKVLYARKLFKESDCENERQKKYWREIELPCLYVVCRLSDEAGHPGAVALAASMRDELKNDGKVRISYSVEGSTLKREGQRLTRTIVRGLAITFKPANKGVLTGILEDPGAPPGFDRKPYKEAKEDWLKEFTEAKKSERDPDAIVLGGYFNETDLPPDDLVKSHAYSKCMECSKTPSREAKWAEGKAHAWFCDAHFLAWAKEHKSDIDSVRKLFAGRVESKFGEAPGEKMKKAITAGNYNVAPGQLSGGAALQVEDPSLKKRFWRNQARAALRDWDGSGPFKEFLKHRLPDADPEFVERFADMVDDYHLKKAQAAIARKEKPQVEMFAPVETGEGQLTIRGRPVPPTPAVEKPFFDGRAGTLRTPRGSFKMYIPSRDPDPRVREAFHNIMEDPADNKLHGYAMKNWRKAHHLLKAGKLPEQVVMHAALFSILSKNTGVPVQELMYGKLVDAMRETGIDARDPRFETLKDRWMSMDVPDVLPRHAPTHWHRIEDQLRLFRDSKDTSRKAGELYSYSLANNKFESMETYHKWHAGLLDMVRRHGVDARAATRELMAHKMEFERWRNRGETAEEYTGLPVKGMAPKLGRYMFAMMGAGNALVFDTHLVRYLFGLEKGRDTASIDYLKDWLQDKDNNADILDGIDRYYLAHHDAIEHMEKHPELKGVDREQLVFPAFWRNWVAIVPHEQKRYMRTLGHNEGTDHRPFWEAVEEYLDARRARVRKADQDAWAQAVKSVKTHMHWQELFGEVPAMVMYFAELLPELLGDADPDLALTQDGTAAGQVVRLDPETDPNGGVAELAVKFERWAVDLAVLGGSLRKAEAQAKAMKAPKDVVEWQGAKVRPGQIRMHGEGVAKWHVLGHDDEHFYVVPRGQAGLAGGDVNKLSRLGRHASYVVESWPQVIDRGTLVDAQTHGHPGLNLTQEQHDLIHGLDFGPEPAQAPRHARSGVQYSSSHWRVHPDGRMVYLKGDPEQTDFSTPRREVVFHNLARDIFGLGHMVPLVSLVQHPQTGQELAAIERVQGGEHYDGSSRHREALVYLLERGELDRAGIMDWVLGSYDRHSGNYLLDKDGALKLIDHGFAFAPYAHETVDLPDYLADPTGPLHPAAQDWAAKLNPQKLAQAMRAQGVPERYVTAAVQRMTFARTTAEWANQAGERVHRDDFFDPERQAERRDLQLLSRAEPCYNGAMWYEDDDMGEELTKGRKDALQMYPEVQRQAPETKAHVDWAYSKLPNENWSLWAVRHHRQKPQDFTPEVKQKIEHFSGSQHLPEVAAVRFGKEVDLHQGLGMLEGAERQYIDRSKKQLQLAPLPRTAKNILDFGDGWAWWDLNQPYDIAEGKAMGHCGNEPSVEKGDSVLSLRRTHVLGGRKYYEPHLTFIRNGEFLGQMKGRGNEKPVQEYHSKIAELLKLGYIPHGGGYLSEHNFHVKDFDEGLYQQVAAKNPAVKFYREGILEPNLKEKFLAGPIRVRQILARDPSLHLSAQEVLAQDPALEVRQILARNPSLHPSLQERLVQDNNDIWIRRYLALNPSLHLSMQERLAQDDDAEVRYNLADRPSLHPSLQERLAQDKHAGVRNYLADNPSLVPALQERLAQDKDIRVRGYLARNPVLTIKVQEMLAMGTERGPRYQLALNPSLSPSLQERLALDRDVSIHAGLASNPSLDPAVQEILARNAPQYSTIETNLLRNPSLHPQVRTFLKMRGA